VVHLLECIFSTYSVTGGRINLFCLTKTTTKLVRGLLYQSVSTALDDHGDILSDLAIRLRYLHSQSIITYKYLNLEARTKDPVPISHMGTLGSSITEHQDQLPNYPPEQVYMSPPHCKVHLTYNNKPLVTRIRSIIRNDLYSSTIQETICKQEAWSAVTFTQIDWQAHEYAFKTSWTCKRFMYTKLVHNLLNTNVQNRRYYGTSDLCPCCQ